MMYNILPVHVSRVSNMKYKYVLLNVHKTWQSKRHCSVRNLSNLVREAEAHQVALTSEDYDQNTSRAAVRARRCELYDAERERQAALVTRAEKIEVDYDGPDRCKLVMNRDISTPYHCALHISEYFGNNSAVALVDGKAWDMHRPLEDDCNLKFLTYTDKNPVAANIAYWRSCSFLLGYVLDRSFKAEHQVTLHSWPKVNLSSGSFVYDAQIELASGASGRWVPRYTDLLSMSRLVHKLRHQPEQPQPGVGHDSLRFHTLLVKPSLAADIFRDNMYKCSQIESIAAGILSAQQLQQGAEPAPLLDDRIRVYRLGDHVDISIGPMISTPSQVGLFHVTAVHCLDESKNLYRIQGISIPHQLRLHHWTFTQLSDRAAILNSAPVPKL